VTGATGPTGATGSNGGTGGNGSNGANGAAGSNGSNGATGATGAAGSNGTNGTNGSNGANGVTGATGPTGAAGSNGTAGATGPTGPTGPKGETGATGTAGTAGEKGATGNNTPFGTTGEKEIKSGGEESGIWSATINAATGSRQSQTQGVVSYPLKLKLLEKPTAVYKGEAESKVTAKAPCEGSTNKPVANAGTLCVYSGGGFGAAEAEFTEAEFKGFMSPVGEVCETVKEGATCKSQEAGELILFRTKGFVGEAGGGPALGAMAYFNQFGSWAVKVK
jgi:hypothetical protein